VLPTTCSGDDKMNPVYTFTKKIKGETVVHGHIADPADISKVHEVIQKLETLPRVTSSNLDEIGLKTNPKKWVVSLVKSYPHNVNPVEMENLLFDFTDTMQTRMREESKYVIGLLTEKGLVLCHSISGEETITPEWRIIPRMLDTDNVLRYVCFVDQKGIVFLKFWEREATSSFIEWLGLPRKQGFLFGPRYKICSEIDGITTELQLTEQEMERWMKEHSEFKDGKIQLSRPVQFLNVSEIRAGTKRYQNAEDFIQDYESQRYGVPQYQKEYERINAKFLPLLMKYYDEKTQVVRKEGDEVTVEVAKSTPHFDILFANENIQLRASYLADISRRFINGEAVNIFHAGLRFRASPFVFGSLEIYNELQLDTLTQWIARYHNETNLQDRNLDILVKCAGLKIMEQANTNLPIAYVFRSLSQEIVRGLSLEEKLSKLEDEVIEYKSRDSLAGGNEEVVEKLSQDLENKLKRSPCKMYIVGVEDNGTLAPIPASELKSDRIESIKNGLQKALGLAKLYTFPVIQREEGILFILALRS